MIWCNAFRGTALLRVSFLPSAAAAHGIYFMMGTYIVYTHVSHMWQSNSRLSFLGIFSQEILPAQNDFSFIFHPNTGTYPVLNDAVSHTVVQFNNGNCQGHKQILPPAHTQPSFTTFNLNTRWRHTPLYVPGDHVTANFNFLNSIEPINVSNIYSI